MPKKEMTPENIKRRDDILRMRFELKMRLSEIAAIYGISRERVRQIIGMNTGYMSLGKYGKTLENEQWLEQTKSLTNKQVGEIVGINTDRVSEYRSGIRHAVEERFAVGAEYQEKISEKLQQFGIENTLSPMMKVPHIVTRGGLGIVVRVALPIWKTSPKMRSPQYRFLTKIRHGVDFFVFVARDVEAYFIVPASRVKEDMDYVIFAYPTMIENRLADPWQGYQNRWDLIIDAESLAVQEREEKERIG